MTHKEKLLAKLDDILEDSKQLEKDPIFKDIVFDKIKQARYNLSRLMEKGGTR